LEAAPVTLSNKPVLPTSENPPVLAQLSWRAMFV